MALRIELPSGQIVMVDELTGDIVANDPGTGGAVDPRIGTGLGQGGLAGPSQYGITTNTSAGTSGGALPKAPDFSPTTPPPPGYVWVPKGDGSGEYNLVTDRTFKSGGENTLSPNTIYSQTQQNVRDAAGLAENIRQYNESFGADKAQFNMGFAEDQRQFNERLGFDNQQLDVRRGETLLNLGSRPDTLIRYLFALRGQQPPQGLATPPNLPGFGNVSAPALATGSGATPPITPPTPPTPPFVAPAAPLPPPGAVQGGSFVGQTPVGTNPVNVTTETGSTVRTPTSYQNSQIEVPLSQFGGTAPSWLSGAVQGQAVAPSAEEVKAILARQRGYAEGGVIPEMVVGMGMDSGQMYTLGERAHEGEREVVVPEHKVPKDLFEKLMEGASEVDYSEDKQGQRKVKVKRGQMNGMNSYAEGGTLGFDPKVFNPDQVRNEFGFPQIPHFTGGTSYVPSAQRLFSALPSERSLYSGYLQDEPGLQSEDVFEMARRLAPKATGLQAGRFTN